MGAMANGDVQEDEEEQDTGYRTLSAVNEDEADALPARLHYNNFDLFCTVVSMLTYLFDLVMDCAVAYYFYYLAVHYGIYHYWYFGLTVTFILLPSLTMTGFSFRWYLMDAENSQLPEVSVTRWIIRLVALMFQVAPILRYVDSIRYGLLSRKAAREERRCEGDSVAARRAREKTIKYYTLMVYEDADATLLRLFEGFMESAPQLVLQIYILIKDPKASNMNDDLIAGDEVADGFVKSTILIASVVSSLVSLAWSLVVYHRSLRYTYPQKNNLDWRGSVSQFAWHFSSITARVVALSLFASVHPEGIGLVCAAHWALMSAWVVMQRTEACNTRCEELLFSGVLGVIYIFSFFNAKEERTRYKYLIYYGFCFCENTALIVVWFLEARHDHPRWYFYPGIVGHYLAFFAGLAFMIIYYHFFHPSDIKKLRLSLRKRRKPFVARDKSNSFFAKGLGGLRRNTKERAASSGVKDDEEDNAVEMVAMQRPKGQSVEESRLTEPPEVKPDRISPSVSSPVLDKVDSPIKSVVTAEELLRSSSMPAKPLSLTHHQPARSLKMMGSIKSVNC